MIKYGDKKGAKQFREYSGKLYEKRELARKMQDLAGNIALNDILAQQGAEDRAKRERVGWEQVY